jgi:hypothetical protein
MAKNDRFKQLALALLDLVQVAEIHDAKRWK